VQEHLTNIGPLRAIGIADQPEPLELLNHTFAPPPPRPVRCATIDRTTATSPTSPIPKPRTPIVLHHFNASLPSARRRPSPAGWRPDQRARRCSRERPNHRTGGAAWSLPGAKQSSPTSPRRRLHRTTSERAAVVGSRIAWAERKCARRRRGCSEVGRRGSRRARLRRYRFAPGAIAGTAGALAIASVQSGARIRGACPGAYPADAAAAALTASSTLTPVVAT